MFDCDGGPMAAMMPLHHKLLGELLNEIRAEREARSELDQARMDATLEISDRFSKQMDKDLPGWQELLSWYWAQFKASGAAFAPGCVRVLR